MAQSYSRTPNAVLFLQDSCVFAQAHDDDQPVVLIRLDNDFGAKSISANSSGTLLAVASEYDLTLWGLDLPSRKAKRISELYERSLHFSSRIIRLKWHPAARSDSGLVVLTEKQLISLFFSAGMLAAKEFTELSSSSGLYEEPAGLGFGADDAPLGSLTLYLGTRDGDIYRIFPFFPLEMELREEGASAVAPLLRVGRLKPSFESWNDTLRCKTWVYKRPRNALVKDLTAIEPVRLLPYSRDMYEEEILDIGAGAIGWHKDIIVQAGKSRVNFFALRNAELSSSGALILVASVKFRSAQQTRLVDLIASHWVFVGCGADTEVFDIGEWSRAPYNVLSVDGASPASSAKCVTGVRRLGFPARLITNHREVRVIGSGDRWPLEIEPASLVALPSQSSDGAAGTERAVLIDEAFGEKIERSLEPIQSLPALPLVPDWEPRLSSLQSFEEVSLAFNGRVLGLAKLVALTQVERTAQRKQVAYHIEDLRCLRDRASAVAAHDNDLHGRVDRALARQDQLRGRIESLAKRALRLNRPDEAAQLPSHQEKVWLRELNHQLPAKLGVLEEQLHTLRRSLQATRDSPASSHVEGLSPDQAESLMARLGSQQQLISSLESRAHHT